MTDIFRNFYSVPKKMHVGLSPYLLCSSCVGLSVTVALPLDMSVRAHPLHAPLLVD